MKIYLAGNLPHMTKVDKEYKIVCKAVSRTTYHRLVSFYFSSAANPIWNLTDNVILAVEQFVKERKELLKN